MCYARRMAVRVSVLIPVFNGEATIARAIQSALDQRFDGHEVIAINDGSTDSTDQVLKLFASRIRIVSQENRGLAAARNAGAREAHGEHLAFLDADDTWTSDKLSKSVTAMERDSDLVLVYTDAAQLNEDGIQRGASFVSPAKARAPEMADLLAGWWPILPSTVMMRRATFERCGGFCEQYRRAYEDLDLWLRARETGRFDFVNEPLTLYRTTPIVARMEKYEEDYRVFVRRTTQRYGRRADTLVTATRRAYISALGYGGLEAMNQGDRAEARRKFMRALRYGPPRIRTILRLLRTFLPATAGRMLTGRTREPT